MCLTTRVWKAFHTYSFTNRMSLGSNHEIAYFQVRLVNLVPLPENKREFESVPKVSGDWGHQWPALVSRIRAVDQSRPGLLCADTVDSTVTLWIALQCSTGQWNKNNILIYIHSHYDLLEFVSTQEDVFRIKHELYRFTLIFYVNVWKQHTKDSKCAEATQRNKRLNQAVCDTSNDVTLKPSTLDPVVLSVLWPNPDCMSWT